VNSSENNLKILLRKIDRLANSVAFSKVLGGETELIRSLKEIILRISTDNNYLSIRDIEELVEKSGLVPHHAVRRAAWVLSKFTHLKFIGMEIILAKSQENFWPYPILGYLEKKNFEYPESLKFKLRGFYREYKASIATNKVDLAYIGDQTLYLVEVKAYGPGINIPTELKLPERFNEEALKATLLADEAKAKQLVFMAILPELLEGIKGINRIKSIYYLLPDKPTGHRFFEVIPPENYRISELLKNPQQIQLQETDEIKLLKQEIRTDDLKFTGSMDEIYEKIPLCEGSRSIWILCKMFQKQINQEDLYMEERNKLAETIETNLNTIMTSDMRRHDFEDQLERRGYIGRIPWKRKVTYFITPSGIVRAYYYLSKTEKINEEISPEEIVQITNTQARKIIKELKWEI